MKKRRLTSFFTEGDDLKNINFFPFLMKSKSKTEVSSTTRIIAFDY